MSKETNKSVEELLTELHHIEKAANVKSRLLKTDEHGNFLLDPKNKQDIEWYENDEGYDVIED